MVMEDKKIKIGVISDTHLDDYNDNMKKLVTEHFRDVDMILHAGDMVNLEVLKIFGEKEVKAVCGNMDNISVKEKFPEHLLFNVKGLKFLLTHGWGAPRGIEERISAGFKDVNCVVYGHTHKPANHKKDNVLFFNPGSAMDRYFNSSKTIGILEIDKDIKGRIINI
jgi:putative phosphoesterase